MKQVHIVPLVAAVLGVVAMLPGCADKPKKQTTPADAAAEVAAEPQQPDSNVADAAQQEAQRLAEAMARAQLSQQPSDAAQVQWVEPGSPVPMTAAQRQEAQRRAAATQPAPAVEPSEVVIEPTPEPAVVEVPAEPRVMSREELLGRLLEDVRHDAETPLDKALTAAVLSLAAPETEIDRELLASLNEADRQTVRQYHHILLSLKAELAAGGTMDREALAKQFDELLGEKPLSIEHVTLCKRVSGYGIYEPFESSAFLAGQAQKMIVYVELANFDTHERAQGEYEVKLSQEVVLYNAADGLAVWRHDPVEIVDRSRNRRRDFFVVQLITLPARLGTGKYRLKIRTTDQHGGSIDETTLPIELVADASMVSN